MSQYPDVDEERDLDYASGNFDCDRLLDQSLDRLVELDGRVKSIERHLNTIVNNSYAVRDRVDSIASWVNVLAWCFLVWMGVILGKVVL